MTRPVFSAAMSGGHARRDSTAFAARRRARDRQYARYGGHSSCVSRRGRRPAADRVRSRHRPAPVRRRSCGAASSTARCCSRTCTGTTCRACRSSRRCTTPASTLDIYGPRQDDGPLGEVFAQMMRPPFFPIRPDGLSADVRFHDTGDDDFPIGLAKVRSRWVRHVGPTLGFRVEWNGALGRVHPRPRAGLLSRRPRRLRARTRSSSSATASTCLIHDAQHTPEEYEPKRHWGHCTVDYAVHVARESGAKRARAVPPRPGARRRRARSHRRPHGRSFAPRWAGPRSSRPTKASRSTSRRPGRMTRAARARSTPTPQPCGRSLGHFATGVVVVTASTTTNRSAWRATRSRRCRSIRRSCCSARRSRRSTWPRIQAAGKWAANVLGEDGEEVCRLFAEKGADRFAHITYPAGPSGAPILDRALAFVDCETDRGARRRRPRDRRRPRARARLPVAKASRCSSTAAGTAGTRARPPAWVRSRSARASCWR